MEAVAGGVVGAVMGVGRAVVARRREAGRRVAERGLSAVCEVLGMEVRVNEAAPLGCTYTMREAARVSMAEVSVGMLTTGLWCAAAQSTEECEVVRLGLRRNADINGISTQR